MNRRDAVKGLVASAVLAALPFNTQAEIPFDNTLKVYPIEGFEKYIVGEKAKSVLKGTIYDNLNVCYLQATYDPTVSLSFEASVQWLARRFEKAVEKGIIVEGLLLPPSYLKLAERIAGTNEYTMEGSEKYLLFIWGRCGLENNNPKCLNELMDHPDKLWENCSGPFKFEGMI